MASASQAKAAQQRWELENNVQEISESDALFKFDDQANAQMQQQRPWSTDPHHFKQCGQPHPPHPGLLGA